MARLFLHLFGAPRMILNGEPIEVDTRKATALLAYLAVTGQAHQRDTLAGLLWPDYDQTNARAALRRTLSTLNRALEDEAGSPYLEVSRENVALASTPNLWLDVRAFQDYLTGLNEHGHSASEICPACIGALKAAAELYREPFMAGFSLRDSPNFEEWQFFQDESLRRELSNALEKLVLGLSASGQVEEAIHYARRWLALDPLLEEAHRQLMLLYTQADQRNAALRQYRECVRILEQELGVAPLEETTQLYQSIMNRDPLLENERRLRFLAVAPSTSAGATRIETVLQTPSASEPAALPRRLVAREAETQQLARAFEAAASGAFAALEGEAGIGKTSLAEAFLASAQLREARVLQARCYAGESGLAYAPFIEIFNALLRQPETAARLKVLPPEVLAEAGRLLPEIYNTALRSVDVTPPALTLPTDGAQARFFDALRQVLNSALSGSVPGVLFIDDLHWADSATLDLLTYLVRRLKGTRMLVLAAWRSEPTPTVQSLQHLAGEVARSGQAAHLRLQRLTLKDTVQLVEGYAGQAFKNPESLGRHLFQESEGLPFVAVEYLTALAARPQPQDSETGGWEMPASVRDLLRSRIAGLDAAALQLLSTAAVIGRSFDFNTLRETSGRSEIETVDGLDSLLAAGLVVERAGESAGPARSSAEIRYDFTHEKLRALIYEETSLARRRLLHRRTAETLARLPLNRSETPGLVAYHYEQAGLAAHAAEYHLMAGEQARRLFANVEALGHFQAALAAGHPDAARLHEAIGDLQTLRGNYSAALHSYQTAAALCSPGCLANLEHKLGNVHQRLGEWSLAESHYQASLEALGDAPESDFHVHLFADLSLAAYSRGDLNAAQPLAEHALHLASQIGESYALAQANNMLGMLARARGDSAQAVTRLEASLDAAETLDDPLARIAALNNLSLIYGENDNLDQAIRLAGQALALCQKRGDRHREAALHNNLADLLHRCGREEEAMIQLKQAVVIFAEIGAQPDAPLAEIWKLTEW